MIRVLYLISPSSAALQKVLGHMGAVAIRLTLLVWSPNMWMVSLTVKSWTCTLESAAPVIRIRSPECGKNYGRQIWHSDRRSTEAVHIDITELSWRVTDRAACFRNTGRPMLLLTLHTCRCAHSRVTNCSSTQNGLLITHPNLLQPFPLTLHREWDKPGRRY